MTIPLQEKQALQRTSIFLMDIISMNITDIRKNARKIREDACRCIHHYPFDCRIDQVYKNEVEEFERSITKETV